MSVSDPELHDHKPVELTPPVALTQLVPCWIRERGDQFPTFSNVVEERDNPWIKASVISTVFLFGCEVGKSWRTN
ncbi:hypothetical protein ACQR1I_17760 [Bradyrhizobium sp. HKCCYLS2038]|uniref:hypothetical protein n=1 Tax=unclassified Bradyrhizobium TaxID=2631580 RepID=UPI003EBF7BB6